MQKRSKSIYLTPLLHLQHMLGSINIVLNPDPYFLLNHSKLYFVALGRPTGVKKPEILFGSGMFKKKHRDVWQSYGALFVLCALE